VNRRTHVQATGDAGALEGLLLGVLLTGGHETGHLVLGELDLAATESGQAEVGDLELLGGSTHIDDVEKKGWEMGWERDVKEERRKGSTVYLKCQQPTKSGSTPLSIDNCRNQHVQIFTASIHRSFCPPAS
jgi:hypothetical protein